MTKGSSVREMKDEYYKAFRNSRSRDVENNFMVNECIARITCKKKRNTFQSDN